MILCERCGTKIENGIKFCPNCGLEAPVIKKVEEKQVELICSSCGAVLKQNVKFCADCGTPVKSYINTTNAPQFQSQMRIGNTDRQSGISVVQEKNGWQYFCAALKKYAVFTGRARRAEYWWFSLFYLIIMFVVVFISTFISTLYFISIGMSEELGQGVGTIVQVLLSLLFFLPGWGVAIRRMHDVDKRGWFILVPIYSLVLALTEGTQGQNRFGGNTKKSHLDNNTFNVSTGQIQGTASSHVYEPPTPSPIPAVTTAVISVFPKIIVCQKCGKKMKALKSGRFRCPGCQSTFTIDANGNYAVR
ncbi:hypothetical protein AGMMS49991_09490 [Spirochaetia bacterium]|nr:hypothetical protein AGMMS49991_09490 [Spirochaetia bacterium]